MTERDTETDAADTALDRGCPGAMRLACGLCRTGKNRSYERAQVQPQLKNTDSCIQRWRWKSMSYSRLIGAFLIVWIRDDLFDNFQNLSPWTDHESDTLSPVGTLLTWTSAHYRRSLDTVRTSHTTHPTPFAQGETVATPTHGKEYVSSLLAVKLCNAEL